MTFLSTSSSVAIGISMLSIAFAAPVSAQTAGAEDEQRAGESGQLPDIVVTARKREEKLQSVPLAVSVLGDAMIEGMKLRSLGDLTTGLPNVNLAESGTVKGTANFSIRGLSASGTIAGIDPAVGVFIDGVYVGINNGLVLDTFDIDNIQILRGPQGTLFGRNVTGGAVLLNTKKPSDQFEVQLKSTLDGNPDGTGGLNVNAMGSITGGLAQGISGRLVASYGHDGGYYVNKYNGRNIGRSETILVRPSLRFQPGSDLDILLRYEYQKSTGDAVPSKSFVNGAGVPPAYFGAPPSKIPDFSKKSSEVSIDAPTYDNRELHAASIEANWNVAFGDGTITNSAAFRNLKQSTLTDVDSQPVWLFHGIVDTDYSQVSNELRYVGNFGDLGVTAGVYYFRNWAKYNEVRDLLGIATGGVAPAVVQAGGGLHNVTSWSGYSSLDYRISPQFTINGGINVTTEKKSVKVATLIFNDHNCHITGAQSCPYDFIDDHRWTMVSPKLGLTFSPNSNFMMYASWARGFRSGNYNLRNTNADVVNFGPGPIAPEKVDGYELGIKKTLPVIGHIYGALFYNHLAGNQRGVQTADGNSGVLSVARNAANLEIRGFEVEGVFTVMPHLNFIANFGYADAFYSKVFYDLNNDGAANSKDKELDVPGVNKLSYSVGLTHDADIRGLGKLSSRVNYAYRSKVAQSEDNLEYIDPLHVLDASIDLAVMDGRWKIGVYGKNLLNARDFGGIATLPVKLGPVAVGGTFAPMAKGRVLGVELGTRF